MTRAVVPQMLKQGRGAIVNISSVASLVGIPVPRPTRPRRGASMPLRALAIDYAKDGLRCNIVNPGLIDTPMAAPLMTNPDMLQPILSHYALRRPGTPEEVAKYGAVPGVR
jgi:NAD(P)-dependent dehydrogenase (short-subunit alcohol dehydrogenase family)